MEDRQINTRNLDLNEDRLNGMFRWMTEVPHGQFNKTTSVWNATDVMRRVRLLAAGEGVAYTHWGPDVAFYRGTPLDLSFDFDIVLKDADDFQTLHGKDRTGGRLLRHPITKLKLYKAFLLGPGSMEKTISV